MKLKPADLPEPSADARAASGALSLLAKAESSAHTPERPAQALASNSGALLPKGQTTPMPLSATATFSSLPQPLACRPSRPGTRGAGRSNTHTRHPAAWA